MPRSIEFLLVVVKSSCCWTKLKVFIVVMKSLETQSVRGKEGKWEVILNAKNLEYSRVFKRWSAKALKHNI